MLQFLLALTILVQGNVVLQTDTGIITGVLKTSSGEPAAGVRVTAMAIPDSAVDVPAGASMVSLVATDEAGRYRLENIPVGRYYIAAGRVDLPTYFPGALDRSAGTIVSVSSKATITGLNFALQDSSIRTATTNERILQPLLAVPVQVVVESGIRQPVSANGKFVTIRLTRTSDGVRSDAILDNAAVYVPIPTAVAGTEYHVTIDNLPDGYTLKSLSDGSTDLLTNTLKMTAAAFPHLFNGNQGLILTGTSINVANVPTVMRTTGGTVVPVAPNYAIIVTLGTIPPADPPLTGVRITGRSPRRGSWSVYRGDVPGTFYADGTFELRGVPPGRHIIVLQDSSSAPQFFAAVVSVEDQDLEGVTLNSTGLLPSRMVELPAIQTTSAKGPTIPQLAGLLGRVIDADTGKPVIRGAVTVLGRTMATISIGNDGQFIIPRLLPGSYDLRFEVVDHYTLYETVVIRDEDVRWDFKIRSNQEPIKPVSSQP